MLNFIAPGRASVQKDEFGPDRLREWLSSLPPDASKASKAIIDRLVEFNRTPMHGRLRLRLLDMFRDHIDWLLPQLERRLAQAAPPVSGPLRHVAYLIEKLSKELAAGYASVVLSVPRSWLNLGFKSHLHVPLVRAMDLHARRLALSHRLYARSPSVVWAELHTLYRTAREWGLEDRDIESPPLSPSKVYRRALLLAFAQPTKLLHGDFARVTSYLERFDDLAEIVEARPVAGPACVFLVDPHRDRPGMAMSKRPEEVPHPGDLLLVTARLVERLEGQQKRLLEGIAPATLGLPDEAAAPGYRELMQRLAANWRGERKARSPRMQFHPRIDVWIGLRDVWRVLRYEAPPEPGETTRSGQSLPRASQWIIVNESSRGYALKYMSGELPAINVGELVGIRGRERTGLYVCLVRWIQSNNPEHFELGLQQLGPVVVPAVYKPEAPANAPPDPALFFPGAAGPTGLCTLVAPSGRIAPDQAFSLRHRRGRIDLRALRTLERNATIDLLEVTGG